MDRLILLRHGKAEPESVSGQDFDRILTERGRRDVALVCLALADAGLQPELALVSPAARTLETWAVAATIFPGAQAQETARLHFKGQSGLVLAAFDSDALGEALKWEPSRGGQLFPHLYAPLDPALALSVVDIPLDAEGAPQLGLEG